MKQGNFIYMLVGLLILLIVAPTAEQYFPGATKLSLSSIFISIMMIGIWSLYGLKRWFYIASVLAIAGITLSIFNFFVESRNTILLSLFVVLMYCILSVGIAMKQILFSGKISTNKLVGSVCIYLLIGVIWAILYLFIDLLTINAFQGLSIQEQDQPVWEFIYFSFVTLTTLGYGDVSPLNEAARTLAYFEAICGQFYMAILVASLVGAHMADRLQNKN